MRLAQMHLNYICCYFFFWLLVLGYAKLAFSAYAELWMYEYVYMCYVCVCNYLYALCALLLKLAQTVTYSTYSHPYSHALWWLKFNDKSVSRQLRFVPHSSSMMYACVHMLRYYYYDFFVLRQLRLSDEQQMRTN